MNKQGLRIEVRARGIELDTAGASYVRKHLTRSLRQFRSHLRGVIVRLSDLNGARGGDSDIECRVVVEGNFPTIVISERAASGVAAIDAVADRVNNTVARAIGRMRAQSLRFISLP